MTIISLVLFWGMVINATSYAQSAKNLYYSAEKAYQKLRHDSRKQKYRSHWFECINKFQAVYEYDPDGPWAAAGLYMAGTLYVSFIGIPILLRI